MRFIADFHIHSKYSRATSRDMDIPKLTKWAKLKGIALLGTGDFTHHLWLQELKRYLQPLRDKGLFFYEGVYFILSAELSSIFSQRGKTYRVHNLIMAPSFELAEEINQMLSFYGNLASDGRPVLGISCRKLVEELFKISDDLMLIPAHCLRGDTYLHTLGGIKKIEEIKEGDYVYTHNLNWKRTEKQFKRKYEGKIIFIRPFYFGEGIKVTPEHPFFAIKTYKNCPSRGSICTPWCAHIKKGCKRRFYQEYLPQWIPAQNLEVGDVLVYPRFNKITSDKEFILLTDYISNYALNGGTLTLEASRATRIPDRIQVDKDFCRLMGYFLSEGYTNSRDCISFCFNEDELEYMEDVEYLMEKIFNLRVSNISSKRNVKSKELIFYSKILMEFFKNTFYLPNSEKKASAKSLPSWALTLPPEKQAEIVKGWWRGDGGYTSSRVLMNQMKIIFLRLGIIPSIGKDITGSYKRRGEHFTGKRKIPIRYETFHFSNLSFFGNPFNLLEEKEFARYRTKRKTPQGWIDRYYVYLPIRKITSQKFKGYVYNLEVEDDNSYITEFVTVHNCWTPWFSVFGSNSGFNSLEEAFGKYTDKITALETGLSSDPAMNWRLSELDKFSLVSNSDSHSPSRIGREANVFDCELNYWQIKKVLETKDKSKFLYTVEFFPEEGKYHYDGHRNCKVRLHPKQTRQYKGICPKCGKPLTVGVLNRVEVLADREEGFKPQGAIPYISLVPLEEIIAEVKGVNKSSRQVEREYFEIISFLGPELEILTEIPAEALKEKVNPKICEGIINVRERNVEIIPGYDGEYGKVKVFKEMKNSGEDIQLSLF